MPSFKLTKDTLEEFMDTNPPLDEVRHLLGGLEDYCSDLEYALLEWSSYLPQEAPPWRFKADEFKAVYRWLVKQGVMVEAPVTSDEDNFHFWGLSKNKQTAQMRTTFEGCFLIEGFPPFKDSEGSLVPLAHRMLWGSDE